MNLAIDIGNSFTKLAIMENGLVIDSFICREDSPECIEPVLDSYPGIKAVIIASTKPTDKLETILAKRVKKVIRFDHDVPVPLRNLYKTPHTLGRDRLAAAVGANALFPNTNVLIFDFGTAITIDLVTRENEFLGGNISPGAMTRFRSLHDYTSTLPQRELTDVTQLLSDNTFEAIESGVINGIVYEIEGYINRISEKYSPLKIIFTGGDGNFFAKRLKNPIFATYDLVVYGLNRILEYNAD